MDPREGVCYVKMFLMHPLTEQLLRNRGIVDPHEQEVFLAPDYVRDVHDPFGILNMEKSVERILAAMRAGEEIVIFGDYDCDGIPGSVILHDLFVKIGYDNFRNYIPHRHKEGYGLSLIAVERFITEGVNLIVTVDCGITDVAAVARAQEAGIDVIVTDHHLPGPVLPPAFAILNSKQEGDTYHDNMLCGAGVAFKLAQALLMRGQFADIPSGWEKWLLDMAGVSTIADMVPLVKENRALAYFGLKVLKRSARPGLRALLATAKVDQRFLTEEDIGFTIAPRINAASRMAEPIAAFHMLATQDESQAIGHARALEDLNNARKLVTKKMVAEAHRMVAEKEKLTDVLVVGKAGWSVGVAGIVAAQLVERYQKPVFVWCQDGEDIKGSCRSDGTISVVELMHAVTDGVFSARGGHAQAGGFSVHIEHLDMLENALNKAHKTIHKNILPEELYEIDAHLQLDEVDRETYSAISALAPFGEGNQKPIFAFRGVRAIDVQMFGKTKEHLKVVLGDEAGHTVEAIAWYKTPASYPRVQLTKGSSVTMIAHLEESRFLGRVQLRLKIVDILPA